MTTPDVSHVRRDILLIICGAIVVACVIQIQIAPTVISLSPELTQGVRSRFLIFAPILSLLLLASVFFYLKPFSEMARYLNRGQSPGSDLAQQARTRAYNLPFYLFFALVFVGSLIPILTIVYKLLTQPHYAFAPHFSYVLLSIVISVATALIVASVSRRLLQPVLLGTADLAQDIGRRYEIRLRLAFVVLSLNFVIFYLLGMLCFNQVSRSARERVADLFGQWAHDVAQTAPYLSDEALVGFIAGSDILAQQDATSSLRDPSGYYSIAPPASDESLARGEIVNLTFPLERDDGTWQLGVTYTFAPGSIPVVRNTILILLVFGAIALGLTLIAVHYLSGDITRDLKYVTGRLLDIARHGRMGEKVHTLSLDEVGDLIVAFEQVRAAMAQQQDELNRRVTQMEQLHEVTMALARSVDSEEALHRICEIACDITASDTVMLYLYDPDEDSFIRACQLGDKIPAGPSGDRAVLPAERGTDRPSASEFPREGLTRTVLDSRLPILVHDILEIQPKDEAPDYLHIDPEMIERGIRSVIAVPVISRTQVMGVLHVSSRKPRAYDDNDLQVASALAIQAGATIENARLLDETMSNAKVLEQRARDLLMINRISTDLTSLLDPYEIFNATARHMVRLMEVDHCDILVFDEGASEGVIVAEYPQMGTAGQHVRRSDDPALEQVLITQQPLVVPDILEEPLMVHLRDTLAANGVRAILIAPLVARERVMGAIRLDVRHEIHDFSGEEQELCRTIAAQAAISASNARLLYDLRQQTRAHTRKSQELAEESAKLDAVLTNMADGLVVTDLVGRIMLSNPAFRMIAGLFPGRSLRGRLLSETFALVALQNVITDALADPDQVVVANMELADGRVIKATASALRMHQEFDLAQAGQTTGVVTVLRDITHEVEVDRMKTEFISAVSHELRTPLTSILGFANLIQREFHRRIAPLVADDVKASQTAERILENLAIIEAESQRLTRLINDVLDIAKMESGQIEWHMAEVNVADVIQNAVKATTALAQERNLAVDVAIPAPLPSVWGDQDRLMQVMTNLLSNAIKFTEKGQITIGSRVLRQLPPYDADSKRAAKRAARSLSLLPAQAPADLVVPALLVAVADTGIGIAQEDLPLVFERFQQVGDALTEKPKGTGLGLPICREIVEHHSGVIWVESELRRGSTFYFALPLHPDQTRQALDSLGVGAGEPTGVVPAVAVPDVPVTARTASPLILVVDDEVHIRQLLRQELNSAGYQVIEAANGTAGLRQARLAHPSLIILDVMMPGVSGFGVIGELRADLKTAQIPIVILSVAEKSKRALELGAAACLLKPVDVPRLLSTIERLLWPTKPAA